MAFLRAFSNLVSRPSSHRARGRQQYSRDRGRRWLLIEALEQRRCPSGGPYLVVSSYGTSSVVRYDEMTADPAPAPGKDGATFVPPNSGGLDVPLLVLFAPNGDLLVDSGEDNTVARYDGTSGDFLGELIDPGSGGLQFPTGMLFSPDGNSFLVASNYNNRILRYDYDGTTASNPTDFIDDPQLASPVGMVFGPDGNLYVSSLFSGSILRYDGTTGAPLPGPGQTGANFIAPGSGGLVRAGGVVFGPDGNLYVSSQTTNEILRFNGTTGDPLPADGQSGATFVTSGSGGLDRPAGLVFGPAADPTLRDIYVVSINTDTIERYDGTTGASLGSFVPAGSGGLSKPRGLAFGYTDPSSLLYNPPGGSARPSRHHKPVTAESEAAGLSSFATGSLGTASPNAAPLTLAPFDSRRILPIAYAQATQDGVASSLPLTRAGAGSDAASSGEEQAPSLLGGIPSATGDVATPLGPLSTPLVDLLARNLLEG